MHGHLACRYALARTRTMLDDSGMLVHGRIGGVCVASMLGGKASCPCYVSRSCLSRACCPWPHAHDKPNPCMSFHSSVFPFVILERMTLQENHV